MADRTNGEGSELRLGPLVAQDATEDTLTSWTEAMFVETHTTLPVPLERAEAEILQLLRGRGLAHRSARAVGAGMQLMFVGPSLLPHRLAKLVSATTGDMYSVGRTSVLPMHWAAVGPTARFFPELDAKIGLTPADEQTTVLSLVGTYRPPMGRLGARLDAVALSRVGAATVDTFVNELAGKVRQRTGTHVGSPPSR